MRLCPIRSTDFVDANPPLVGRVDRFPLALHPELLHDPAGRVISQLMDADDSL
jgi:hypothetical protein